MDLYKAMMISAAGMRAQGVRMRVIAENIANSNSVARSANEDPYRRKVVTFSDELNRELGIRTVKVDKVKFDRSDFGLKYDPGHPGADANGYIKTPNVQSLVEMMDMQQAERSYRASLSVIDLSRSMMRQTVEILR